MAHLIVVVDRAPTGEEYVRRRIAELCDAHLAQLLDAAALTCLLEPEDSTTWIIARAAQDECNRRGLIDGLRR